MNKKKIVILFLGDFFYDARAINMAISLAPYFSVTIVSSFEKKINNALFEKIQFYKIIITKKGILKYWEYHQAVSCFLKNNDFDFVISGDLYSLSSACLNKKNKKIIYDCREIYSSLSAHINKPFYRFLCNIYEKFFLKFVDDIMVTAKTDLDFLKKKYLKYNFLNWHIVYNYPFKYAISKPKNLREQYSIPNNHIIVLYQGVIHRGRGLSQLIKLTSISPNITAVIIGGGVEKNYYKKISASLNVSNRVHFIGKIPYLELFAFSSACDLGWAVIKDDDLSYSYALPNKLFEYSLCGLPVIASPLINIKNIIKNYNLGILVNYDNTTEHINAIQNFQKMKRSKLDYTNIAIKHFIWDVQNDVFLKIFNI